MDRGSSRTAERTRTAAGAEERRGIPAACAVDQRCTEAELVQVCHVVGGGWWPLPTAESSTGRTKGAPQSKCWLETEFRKAFGAGRPISIRLLAIPAASVRLLNNEPSLARKSDCVAAFGTAGKQDHQPPAPPTTLIHVVPGHEGE